MSTCNQEHISPKSAFIVWIFLIVASLGTTWIGDHQDAFRTWGVLIVLLVSAIKARVVIRQYMEVRSSAWLLKFCYDLWLLITTLSLVYILFYL